ncbi:hypothetical protein Sala_1864 [Sphingopyxis alaskensis RB2256]|uniref:Uncharacterized protein n=1 Tax=Sphingopyxis alaskensis (strain DSM 13593 / LMG 18877 / RB2256) TaxID=317655 RepID=Q1GRZ6_SPHAL|nr:hypothetical protein Sala_1864 [Sphingopyxis alaskensis RB2256]
MLRNQACVSLSRRERGKAAPHPKAGINKKALSYMARLCQPSSRLFQYVDKSARSPARGCGHQSRAAYAPGAANRRPHKADLS